MIVIELTTNTKITVLMLSLFALRFSHDARSIKDSISRRFSEQRSLNLQWISLFKKLPIGIVITNKKQEVLHTNQKMQEIIGG
jgi:c-di-AMP phosphodiesterase-like protein